MSEERLPVADYFEVLKKEYVITWVRLDTCTTERERRYFTKVLDGKKVKLQKIALQYKFVDIFENREAYEEAFNKNLRLKGAPHFTYRSDEERREMFKKDINNYYSEGSEVRYFPDYRSDDYVTGVILDFSLSDRTVTLRLKGGTKLDVDYRQVTRILQF